MKFESQEVKLNELNGDELVNCFLRGTNPSSEEAVMDRLTGRQKALVLLDNNRLNNCRIEIDLIIKGSNNIVSSCYIFGEISVEGKNNSLIANFINHGQITVNQSVRR